MSTQTLQPVWMTVGATQTAPGTAINGTSMAATITSDAVLIDYTDNVVIQMKWTGTPTGTFAVQRSLDPANLGWNTVTFSPALTDPAGAAGANWAEINQMGAFYVRLVYTAASGTGNLKAKISAKPV